jgi:hypothetical protein
MNTMVPAANRKPRKRNRIFIVYVLQVYVQQVYVTPRRGGRRRRTDSVSAGRRSSLAVLP